MSTFADLMSRSADGMFVIDSTQTIVFWNQASEGLTGITAVRALGRGCHEVLRGQNLVEPPSVV